MRSTSLQRAGEVRLSRVPFPRDSRGTELSPAGNVPIRRGEKRGVQRSDGVKRVAHGAAVIGGALWWDWANVYH